MAGLSAVLLTAACIMGCSSAGESGSTPAAEEDATVEQVDTSDTTTSEEATSEEEPSVGDYLTVDGAYWRNAFENDDYSVFDDDEERELFVFMTLSPAEDNKVFMTSLGAQLVAGTQTLNDSLYMNYGNSYYQSLKDAGFKCLPSTSTGIEPYEDPYKYVAQYFVKGWMVKNADVVTLEISFSIGDDRIEGTIDIPVDSIRPVMVDVEGQPTHPAMIEEMTRMAQE